MSERRLPGLRAMGLCGVLAIFCLVLTAEAAHAQAIILNQSTNLGTWSVGEVEAQLFVTGGTGSFSWQVIGGTMPPGVSLRQPPDLAPWFSTSASAGLIGVATSAGTYQPVLRVTSGAQSLDIT